MTRYSDYEDNEPDEREAVSGFHLSENAKETIAAIGALALIASIVAAMCFGQIILEPLP